MPQFPEEMAGAGLYGQSIHRNCSRQIITKVLTVYSSVIKISSAAVSKVNDKIEAHV
jgi:hypothetical protein